MKLLPTAAAAALISFGGQDLSAQVIINEVNFTTGDQWIELFNMGTSPVNLGNWSIYHATKTPFRFGDYWWAFPKNAELKANEYVRINWGKAIQTTPPPPAGNLFTGETNWHFLFGHGFEALDREQGAIAICTTQENNLVNSPDIFSDWWQWGATGFKRESIATGNQPTALWNVNTTYPKVPVGASMMVLDVLHGFPHELSSLKSDFSPTPLAHNSEGMSVTQENQSCSLNMADISLSGRGYAFHGNTDFQLVTGNTRGPAFFERMFFVIKPTNDTASWGHCSQVLTLATPHVLTGFTPTAINETVVTVPLTHPAAKGVTVYIQAVAFGTQVWSFSFSNHLKLTASK